MLGTNIKKIRKSKQMTLSECAEKTNISKSNLSNIERNVNKNPSIHIIYRLASVLEVDPRVLLFGEDHELERQKQESFELIKTLNELNLTKEELLEYKKIVDFAKWNKNKQ